MKKKGEILIKILDFLNDGAVDFYDAIQVFLSAGYGASFSKLEYENQKKKQGRETERYQRKIFREQKRRLSKYLSKLKQDGLIATKTKDKNKEIVITKKGQLKLNTLIYNPKIFKNRYQKEASLELIIATFDIPEEYRKERDWFRSILKLLDFKMVHKSVWLGQIKIPKELLMDLESRKILEYIEFLGVTKRGSLKNLKEL